MKLRLAVWLLRLERRCLERRIGWFFDPALSHRLDVINAAMKALADARR